LTAAFGYGKARPDWRGIDADAPLFSFNMSFRSKATDGEA
jgi:hypothetical protein